MIVIGFDPGLERVGFGVLRKVGNQITCLEYGLIKTRLASLGPRLKQIHEGVDALISKHQPQSIAVEKLFFTKNQTSAMDVAKALGCVLLAVEEPGLESEEYSPPQVKQALSGTVPRG
ncbi:MAG: crossover junction endodeoxyribonuclease RuvC [Fimbriimonadaceae bacterium]